VPLRDVPTDDPWGDRLAGQQDGRMTQRQLVSSGVVWESVVGYSWAVRVGRWASVSSTAAAEGGGAVGGSDIAAQAREVLRRIAVALEEAGAGSQDWRSPAEHPARSWWQLDNTRERPDGLATRRARAQGNLRASREDLRHGVVEPPGRHDSARPRSRSGHVCWLG